MQPGTKSKRWSRRSGAGGTICAPAVYPLKISTTSTQHFYQSVFSSKNRSTNDGVCRSENSSPRFVFGQSASSLEEEIIAECRKRLSAGNATLDPKLS